MWPSSCIVSSVESQTSKEEGNRPNNLYKDRSERMIALYLAGAAGFYGLMSLRAEEHEETEMTHPAPLLTVMPGGQMFQVLEGGLTEDQRKSA